MAWEEEEEGEEEEGEESVAAAAEDEVGWPLARRVQKAPRRQTVTRIEQRILGRLRILQESLPLVEAAWTRN